MSEDAPSLLSQALAVCLTGFAAIWGFITRQVWVNTSRLAHIEQDLKDLRETTMRMHGENTHRLDKLENGDH